MQINVCAPGVDRPVGRDGAANGVLRHLWQQHFESDKRFSGRHADGQLHQLHGCFAQGRDFNQRGGGSLAPDHSLDEFGEHGDTGHVHKIPGLTGVGG